MQSVFSVSEKRKRIVWNKASVIPGWDPNVWRRDRFGWTMNYQAYGDRNNDYGWEIDHNIPVSAGGQDNIFNMQPLHFRTNIFKSNKFI